MGPVIRPDSAWVCVSLPSLSLLANQKNDRKGEDSVVGLTKPRVCMIFENKGQENDFGLMPIGSFFWFSVLFISHGFALVLYFKQSTRQLTMSGDRFLLRMNINVVDCLVCRLCFFLLSSTPAIQTNPHTRVAEAETNSRRCMPELGHFCLNWREAGFPEGMCSQ